MTHIIRGEDHISNTSRQLMIYESLGFNVPQFVHTAMVLGSDKQKLSKRNGDVSAQDYLEKGYLKEALINFLVLLGWWPKDDFKPISGHPEILSLQEMIDHFSLEHLQKSPAVFDMTKLQWMNGFYIRLLPLSELTERALPFLEKNELIKSEISKKDRGWIEKMIELTRSDITLLSDLPDAVLSFFGEELKYSEEALLLLAQPEKKALITEFLSLLVSYSGEWKGELFSDTAKEISKKFNIKGKDLFMPLRAAITGAVHGADMKGIFTLLGKDLVLARIKNSLKAQ
jgi:nondiscriminating glutamyl-tRNA synthetase